MKPSGVKLTGGFSFVRHLNYDNINTKYNMENNNREKKFIDPLLTVDDKGYYGRFGGA